MINKKAAVTSIGCKVSKYEGSAIAFCLKDAGYEIVDFKEKADIYVINTCTVTNISDKKSRQIIRRAKQINEDSIVVVTGCYSQVAPLEVSEIEDVDIVLGAESHLSIVKALENYENKKLILVSDISAKRTYENLQVKEEKLRTRAYVKIEDGCDNFCSYCIIPLARGRARSRCLQDILEEAEHLTQNGIKEVVLTGIHVGSYGKDLRDGSLLNLIEKIHEIATVKRIRLSSLEPKTITEEFVKALKGLDKFCDYFHLSLQSGSDTVLSRMNRRYTKEDYFNATQIIGQFFPNNSVWSDIIVGFPGETDSEFLESYEFIEKSGIVKLHIFPFSPKKGTKAFNMENPVDSKTKDDRIKLLKDLDSKLYGRFLSQSVETTQEVLLERKGKNGLYFGHTKNNILVMAKSDEPVINEILNVKLNEIVDNTSILGTIV